MMSTLVRCAGMWILVCSFPMAGAVGVAEAQMKSDGKATEEKQQEGKAKGEEATATPATGKRESAPDTSKKQGSEEKPVTVGEETPPESEDETVQGGEAKEPGPVPNLPPSPDQEPETEPPSASDAAAAPPTPASVTPPTAENASMENGDDEGVVVAVESNEPAPVVGEEVKATTPKYLQGSWTKRVVFSSADGLFRFRPMGWMQPKFQFHVNQEAGEGESVVTDTGFSLQRVKVGFEADLFRWAHAYFESGWKTGSPKLMDAYVDVGPEKGDGMVAVRLGYFRPYFGRQHLAVTTELAMIDYAKAWTDPILNLGLGRDLGAAVHGFLLDGIEYGVGVWNGNVGFERSDNGDDAMVGSDGAVDLQTGGRVAFHPLSLLGVGNPVPVYNESDSDMSPTPGLVIGLSFMFEKFSHQQTVEEIEAGLENPSLYNGKAFRFGTDLGFKYQGFSFNGELFLVRRWADGDTPEERVDRFQFEEHNMQNPGIGAHVQLGMFVEPETVEIVGRFDVVDENVEVRGIRFYPTAGVTWYIIGNNLKLQGQWRINVGTRYAKDDDALVVGETAGYMPVSHDFLLMLQLAI